MSFRAKLLRVGLHRPRYSLGPLSGASRLDVRTQSSAVHLSPPSTVEEYSAQLKKELRNVDAIHQYYPSIAWSVSPANPSRVQNLQPASILSENDFKDMLYSLASSGLPKDLSRVEDVLSDMQNVFGVILTSDTHTPIIRGLLKTRNLQTIFNWFANMPSKPGNVIPTLDHYHMLLEACPEFAGFKVTKSVLQMLRQSGCVPDIETYKLVFRTLWRLRRGIPAPSEFTPFIQEMRDIGLPYDESVAELLSSTYFVKGHPAFAQKVLSIYKDTFSEILGTDALLENQWIPRIYEAVTKEGVRAGVDTYHQYISEGGKSSPRIFTTLVQRVKTLDQLYRLRDSLGIEPSREHWSLLLSNNIHAGDMKQAMNVYDHIIGLGQVPIPSVVALLLRTLFWQAEGPPPDATVDMTLQIYSTFANSLPKECASLDVDTLRSIATVYQVILRGTSTSPNQRKYAPVTESILEDMEARQIPGQDMATSLAVMRMRLAATEKEAFYKWYRHSSSSLDAEGFLTVLDVFARLEFNGNLRVPSLTMYFEMVRDMKAAGHPVTSEVYTILLRTLRQLVTRASESAVHYHLVAQIIRATRRVHDLITLDASISPDAKLWNQLMETYHRVGCFADAYRVWDQMYISGRYDNTSVSIILDACGESGAAHLAEQVRAKLNRSGFKFDLHTWKAWITCLCQLGRLNDALKDMCLSMEDPDVETARIILKRVKPEVQEKVMLRIRTYRPALYEALLQEA